MPSRTTQARSPALEIRALAAGLRHSFCTPGAHRGALFPKEYCARTSVRPADSSGLQEYRCRLLPKLLRVRLAWGSLDRVRWKVVRLSTPQFRPRPGAIARPSLLVRGNSDCSLRIPKSPEPSLT